MSQVFSHNIIELIDAITPARHTGAAYFRCAAASARRHTAPRRWRFSVIITLKLTSLSKKSWLVTRSAINIWSQLIALKRDRRANSLRAIGRFMSRDDLTIRREFDLMIFRHLPPARRCSLAS